MTRLWWSFFEFSVILVKNHEICCNLHGPIMDCVLIGEGVAVYLKSLVATSCNWSLHLVKTRATGLV